MAAAAQAKYVYRGVNPYTNQEEDFPMENLREGWKIQAALITREPAFRTFNSKDRNDFQILRPYCLKHKVTGACLIDANTKEKMILVFSAIYDMKTAVFEAMPEFKYVPLFENPIPDGGPMGIEEKSG